MRLREIFGVSIKKVGLERAGIFEREIRALISQGSPDARRIYVVAEELSLMGSPSPDFSQEGKKIVVFRPGDEIEVFLYPPYIPLSSRISERIQINIYNVNHPNVGQVFYFIKSEVEKRTFKINTTASLHYS